jgi:hypothetical protein
MKARRGDHIERPAGWPVAGESEVLALQIQHMAGE